MFPVTLLAPEVTDLNRQGKDSSESLCFVFLCRPMSGWRCLLWSPPLLPHDVSASCTQVGLCWTGHHFGGEKYMEDDFFYEIQSSLCLFATLQDGYFQQWQCPQIINSVFVYLLLNVVWYRLSTWRGHISCWNISMSAVLPPCKQLWTCRVATITERVATVASSIKQHARAWQRWLAGLQTCRSLGVVEVIKSISILIFSL